LILGLRKGERKGTNFEEKKQPVILYARMKREGRPFDAQDREGEKVYSMGQRSEGS